MKKRVNTEKGFIRKNELLISGILILCSCVYMYYSGELIGSRVIDLDNTPEKDQYPIFYWLIFVLWAIMGLGLIIAHFKGRKKLEQFSDYINNKKL